MNQEKWLSPGEFWTSPYNFDSDLSDKTISLPEQIRIHDTTLRDGEQTPGVVFDMNDKVAIAEQIDRIGVHRIEVGSPMVSETDVEIIRTVCSLGLKAETSCVVRAMEKDIDLAVACGIEHVEMEIPLGKPRLLYQYAKWSTEDLISKTIGGLRHAKAKGLKVTLFMMDIGRSEKELVQEVLGALEAVPEKPDGYAVVDTSGSLRPDAMKGLIKFVRGMVAGELEVHTHNDLGLGLANTLAALEAGATVAHTCVNGLGERTGNASLDEVVMALYCLYDRDIGINRSLLTETARLVAMKSGIQPSRNKPITGEGVFCRESGLGIDTIRNAPLAIFSQVPTVVGQQAKIVLGKKSGIASIEAKLEELGLLLKDKDVDRQNWEKREMLRLVKEMGTKEKRILTDDEFVEIYQMVVI